MSDIQRNREERQHVIEVLKSWDGYFIGYTSDEVQEALRYAIASIETDLRYDLLYEETSGQADKPTTKNNLGVDLIPRADVLKLMQDNWHTHNGDWAMQESMDDIRAMPSVTPQEPQSFKWCETCKEYDQEKHCCHRYSKVIRDTVAEIEQEPRWIPVSEKLPEPFTFVNATCRSLIDDRENWVVETLYLPIPKEVNKHGYSDWGNIPMLNLGDAEVIAWVERIIPQPYKAEIEPQESEDKE